MEMSIARQLAELTVTWIIPDLAVIWCWKMHRGSSADSWACHHYHHRPTWWNNTHLLVVTMKITLHTISSVDLPITQHDNIIL